MKYSGIFPSGSVLCVNLSEIRTIALEKSTKKIEYILYPMLVQHTLANK